MADAVLNGCSDAGHLRRSGRCAGGEDTSHQVVADPAAGTADGVSEFRTLQHNRNNRPIQSKRSAEPEAEE